MKRLLIMRGLPGSGKSFLAKLHYDAAVKAKRSAVICSTDDFFMVDGEYKFDPAKLHYNHKQNFLKASQAIIDEIEIIIIDNTNTCTKEVRPYVEIAIDGGYEVFFMEPPTTWARDIVECMRRGSHNVPMSAYEQMAQRWEESDDIGECLEKELNCDYDIVYEVLTNKDIIFKVKEDSC